ncbi:methyltransferase domain-containing protein [Brachybacterium sp. J144]|uniref:methyltransferase domain-containing protein n=1 Tax=Brachybacterium sp. J144 TaxID=3116487 RepID=UPI002E79F485|nr:methyltransferase domain-containing protein [Brachybacterium sp. J144]MEE1650042.1 methyltransferase domain-containing protein [Brachybacterium sp. J144]
MRCSHYEAGECRSCTLLDLPRARQVQDGGARVRDLLAPFADGDVWGPPIVGAESGFRARGKMAVGGTAQDPVLTLPGQKEGADLSDCPLYPAGVEEVLQGVRALIRRAQVPPYDVARRRGEIKNVLVTASPDREHLLRLVLRSEASLERIREHLPAFLDAHRSVVSVSANLHPEHTTAVEGAREIPLWGASSVAVRTGDVVLHARPRSFLQTHTEVAGELYRQGAAWLADLAPAARIWDLYCGLGGFALHVARALPQAEVTGVEVSAKAIDGAREAATELGVAARFLVADATQWAIDEGVPDAVVVNPPRRGLGPRLSAWLEDSGVPDVVYSSCNPTTLAADLAAMPSLRITAGRYVDMFPHTAHAEAIVRLRRRSAP